MKTPNSRPRDQLAMVAASVAHAACLWGVSLVIALLGGAAALGEFAYALAATSPVYILAELGLRNVYITLRRRPRLRSMLSTRIVAATLAGAISMLLAILPSGPAIGIVLALTVAKLFDSAINVCYGMLQRDQRLISVAAITVLHGVGVLVAVSCALLMQSDLAGAVWAWSGVSVTTFLIVAPLTHSVERRSRDPETSPPATVVEILKAGIPVGGAQGLASLMTYLPVIALGVWSDPTQVGLYAALSYFITFAHLGLAALQQARLPALVQAVRAARTPLPVARRLYARPFAFASVAAAIGVAAAGSWILRIVYGPDFAVGPIPLLLTAVAILGLGTVYSSGGQLLAMNAYASQLRIAILSLAATCVPLLMLHRTFDVTAAATVVLTTTLVRALYGVVIVRRRSATSTD